MRKLKKRIEEVKNSDTKKIIDKRMKEFHSMRRKSNEELFKELSFCLMTANFNAERAIKIQNEINTGFLHLPEKKLASKLKELGHRFPNMRSKFIVNAREHKDQLRRNIKNMSNHELREWLIKNIKGLGYKESSHFLRNIGFTDFAILDFHIIDILSENGLIERPKTLTKKNYLEIENKLKDIGKKLNMNMSELDLYLWYLETGKVLK